MGWKLERCVNVFLSPMLSEFLIFFMCLGAFRAWYICNAHVPCVCSAQEGQKRVSHPLELDLSSGTQTQEPRSSARTRALNC